MFRKKTGIALFLILGLVFMTCEKKETKDADVEEAVSVSEAKEINSVCVWDKGALRNKPTRKGKWVSQMALGEKVVWSGETSVDSTDKNREYLKLRLSDGTEGWASEYVIVTDAKPAVLIKDASIYNRPDLLTDSERQYKEMDIVAIITTEGDWVKVIGKEKKRNGWVSSKSVSTSDVNVAVALLTSKALSEKKDQDKIEKLQAVLTNNAFNASVFIPTLDKKLAELIKPAAAPGAIDSLEAE